jgi:uncharacterized membrane protein YcaP (DUF421 family)
MDSIIRAVFVYLTLLLIFRIAGKRTLSDTTTFDLVLTLIISEAVQQALVDSDNSLTNALLLVVGLVGFDILMSLAKQRSPLVAKLIEGTPLVLIEKDTKHRIYMERERVDEAEIMQAARHCHGIERMDQIDYAVVETSGDITIVPKKRES